MVSVHKPANKTRQPISKVYSPISRPELLAIIQEMVNTISHDYEQDSGNYQRIYQCCYLYSNETIRQQRPGNAIKQYRRPSYPGCRALQTVIKVPPDQLGKLQALQLIEL